jgi:hypothetical protein
VSNIMARTYDDFRTVTPSDGTDDPAGPFAGLLVTVAGTLKVTTRMGTTIALAAVAVGQEIHVPVKRVWSTGTGATVVGMIAEPFRGVVGV